MIIKIKNKKNVNELTLDEILLPAGTYNAMEVVKRYLEKYDYCDEIFNACVKSFVEMGFPICSKLLGHPVVDEKTSTIVGRDILPTLVVLALGQNIFHCDAPIYQELYVHEVLGEKGSVRYQAFREAFIKFLGKLNDRVDSILDIEVETFEEYFDAVTALVKCGEFNDLMEELEYLRFLGGWGKCEALYDKIQERIDTALESVRLGELTLQDVINRYDDYSLYDKHGQIAKEAVVFADATEYFNHLLNIAKYACFSEKYVPLDASANGRYGKIPFCFMVECLDYDLYEHSA